MNEADLRAVMRSFQGGSEGRFTHPFNPRFIYTEGVRAVAQRAGAYWLLDIVATEVFERVDKNNQHAILKLYVNGSTGLLELSFSDEEKQPWQKFIPGTDFPEGTWVFEVAPNGFDAFPVRPIVMSLIEEH